MADESLFDFLHSEVINYVCNNKDSNEDKKVITTHNNLTLL